MSCNSYVRTSLVCRLMFVYLRTYVYVAMRPKCTGFSVLFIQEIDTAWPSSSTYTRQPRTRSFMVQIVKLRDTPLRANASSLPLTIVPCSSGHSPSTNTDNLVLSPTSPSTVNLVPTCTLITHNVYKLGWATTLLNTCSSKITTKPHQLDSYRKPINNGKPNLPTKESTTVPHGSPALIMPNSQANGPNRSLDLTLLMP